MIADLKPYPTYKDSGVEWLGRVPKAWSVLPLAAGFRSALQRNTGMVERTVLSLSYGQIVVKPEDKLHGLAPESFETYQCVFPGDIIVRTTDLQNDQTSFRVGAVRTKGIITSAYLRLIARENLMPAFGYLVLHAYDVMKVIYGYGSGLRQTLDFGQMKRIPMALPSASEQIAIACFLKYFDARIQRFISAKDRLVELLNEEKRVVIDRVLIRGLNSDAPRKPSGVEYLGDVPAHWDVLDFGRMVDLLPGFAFPSMEFSDDKGDLRLLRGVNITPGKVRWDEVVHWPAVQSASFGVYKLEVGDLVLGLDRPIIAAGVRVAPVTTGDVPSLLHQRVARLRARPGLLPKYAEFLIRGDLFRGYISPIFTGISVPHLSPDQVKAFRIGLPDIAEQERIVAFLSHETAALQAAIHAAQRQNDLLREYRMRLISDIVTGKLDVREAAAKLPDDPDAEDPALDERLEEVAAG